jgi:hypothetical protein
MLWNLDMEFPDIERSAIQLAGFAAKLSTHAMADRLLVQ